MFFDLSYLEKESVGAEVQAQYGQFVNAFFKAFPHAHPKRSADKAIDSENKLKNRLGETKLVLKLRKFIFGEEESWRALRGGRELESFTGRAGSFIGKVGMIIGKAERNTGTVERNGPEKYILLMAKEIARIVELQSLFVQFPFFVFVSVHQQDLKSSGINLALQVTVSL